jgi:hypothetical protein
MPKNAAGVPIDPTEWNRNDGFSPGSAVQTLVPGLDRAAGRVLEASQRHDDVMALAEAHRRPHDERPLAGASPTGPSSTRACRTRTSGLSSCGRR